MPIDLTKWYLQHAAGCRATVRWRRPAAAGPADGAWVVQGTRLFVRFVGKDSVGLQPLRGWADVRLNLDTGVYRFGAWLEPSRPTGLWEVLPDQRVSVEQCRLHIRAPFTAPLVLEAVPDGACHEGHARDLSTTGLGFVSAVTLAPGRVLVARASGSGGLLGTGMRIHVVRRQWQDTARVYSYGALFVDLRADDRQELAAIMVELVRAARAASPETV